MPAAPWVVTGVLVAGAVVTGAVALGASSALKADTAVYPNANAAQITSNHNKTFATALVTDILIGGAVVSGIVSVVLTVSANKRKPADEEGRAARFNRFPSDPAARRAGGPAHRPARGRTAERPALRHLLTEDVRHARQAPLHSPPPPARRAGDPSPRAPPSRPSTRAR